MAKKGSKGYLHLSEKLAKPYDHDAMEKVLDAERVRAVQARLDFVFSVVVPVYNTEQFLEECIQSVARQTVGFGDIQLILVDDGSKDGSAAICSKWAQRFSQNVTFVQQANAGVSAARNTGLSHVRGLWVNFLDSDDMWTVDAFAQMLLFHAAHPEQRAIAERHWFFGVRNEAHALDYKFSHDHVVDLDRDIDCVQHSFSNLFVESSLLKDLRFDTSLQVSEDFALVNELLMDLGSYGACEGGTYLYRKREGGGSAIDVSTQNLSYYEQTPRRCYQALFDLSRKRFGQVIPYIQYCVMYDVQWRLKVPVSPLVSSEVVARYRQIIVELLQSIDDKIITSQRHMSVNEVTYALALKYGTSVEEVQTSLRMEGDSLVWAREQGNVIIWNLKANPPSVYFDFVHIHGDKIVLEGRSEFLSELAHPGAGIRLEFLCNGERKEAEYVNRPHLSVSVAFPEDRFRRFGFSVELPWNGRRAVIEAHVLLCGAARAAGDVGAAQCGDGAAWAMDATQGGDPAVRPVDAAQGGDPAAQFVGAATRVDGATRGGDVDDAAQCGDGPADLLATLSFDRFVGLNEGLSYTYWHHDGCLLTARDLPGMWSDEGNPVKGALIIKRENPAKAVALEQLLRMELVLTREWGLRFAVWRAIACEARRRRELSSRQVWLISDRPMKAGDNGEALYQWLLQNPQPGVTPVFALSRKSTDWKRICSYGGEVVDFGSFAYKRLFLRANMVISAAADEFVINGVGPRRQYLKDLFGFRYAFLQHGVTKGDQSAWLNRYNKDIRFIACCAPRERESFLADAYAYGPGIAKLTGFPRHDSLIAEAEQKDPERVVWLMPTWRHGLVSGEADQNTGVRPANPNFEDSEYYRFWQGLVSDARLNNALLETGYTLRLVMHPSFVQEAPKFHPGPAAELLDRCEYREAFVTGAVLVTDYSSVAFDFALLCKPVVYAQFDREDFYGGLHMYDGGYFDDRRDGFGPVCEDLDQTVDTIIELVHSGCVMPEEYRARVEEFYGEQPDCRCEAVARALLELED